MKSKFEYVLNICYSMYTSIVKKDIKTFMSDYTTNA